MNYQKEVETFLNNINTKHGSIYRCPSNEIVSELTILLKDISRKARKGYVVKRSLKEKDLKTCMVRCDTIYSPPPYA